MANSLYNQFNNVDNNNITEIINKAKELRKNFNGNPQNIVQNLLNSGQMSQEWFNKMYPIAQQISSMIK